MRKEIYPQYNQNLAQVIAQRNADRAYNQGEDHFNKNYGLTREQFAYGQSKDALADAWDKEKFNRELQYKYAALNNKGKDAVTSLGGRNNDVGKNTKSDGSGTPFGIQNQTTNEFLEKLGHLVPEFKDGISGGKIKRAMGDTGEFYGAITPFIPLGNEYGKWESFPSVNWFTRKIYNEGFNGVYRDTIPAKLSGAIALQPLSSPFVETLRQNYIIGHLSDLIINKDIGKVQEEMTGRESEYFHTSNPNDFPRFDEAMQTFSLADEEYKKLSFERDIKISNIEQALLTKVNNGEIAKSEASVIYNQALDEENKKISDKISEFINKTKKEKENKRLGLID